MEEDGHHAGRHAQKTATRRGNGAQAVSEKGFDRVSVDNIIEATGTSKGTFYHYFKSKDEIILDIYAGQFEILDRWNAKSPAYVKSLEGHVNRLFLDLAANIADRRKLICSALTLVLQNEKVRRHHDRFVDHMRSCLLRWLPDPLKVNLLIAAYLVRCMTGRRKPIRILPP